MKAIIYGAGLFAEYLSYAISNDSDYDVVAYCVDHEFLNDRKEIGGLPLVAFETVETVFQPGECDMFVAVGNNEIRAQKCLEATEKGYKLLTYISSKSDTWPNLQYGRNVFIGEGSIIQPFVTIGDNCMFMGVRLGHHTVIGHNNVLSGTFVGGSSTIGNNCFFGLNSTIRQGVTIGNNNIIGMGCAIIRNTKDDEVYRSTKSTTKSEVPADRIKKAYLRY
ncbi:MAG: hypothetical protein DA446_08005 [Bacteroidetes bacterium]|nr:acetyltransferase [Bacteroidota bacterium]PTM19531.1 MAG: hypothetical protein DA446_08005 [Bacteroidota bacterium]